MQSFTELQAEARHLRTTLQNRLPMSVLVLLTKIEYYVPSATPPPQAPTRVLNHIKTLNTHRTPKQDGNGSSKQSA